MAALWTSILVPLVHSPPGQPTAQACTSPMISQRRCADTVKHSKLYTNLPTASMLGLQFTHLARPHVQPAPGARLAAVGARATRTYRSRHASSAGASSGNQPSVVKSASRAATRPPGAVTRRASRSALTGSLMCCSTCRRSAIMLVDRQWTVDRWCGDAARLLQQRAHRVADVLQHLPSAGPAALVDRQWTVDMCSDATRLAQRAHRFAYVLQHVASAVPYIVSGQAVVSM